MIAPRERHIRKLLMYVGKPLLRLVLYDVAVVLAYKVLHWNWLDLHHIPLTLFGSAIGIIVAFRNQSSYGRWLEARKLWGAIVSNSRSWARQVTTVMTPQSEADAEEMKAMQRRLVYGQIAFAYALRQQLRGLEPWELLTPLLSEQELRELQGERNVPLAIQQKMGMLLGECQRRGWIEAAHWRSMDNTLNDLIDAQGGTERIKSTPMPKQYDYFPELFVQMYCVMLPLALVMNMGWYTPLGSTLVGFIFLALDKIGQDLEYPFDNTIYDVAMTSMTTTIEINLRQLLGETVLPEEVKAEHGVLW